jgi:DNA-binding transcriptional ArsR family regulator
MEGLNVFLKQQLIVESYEQLKTISDPTRTKILTYTIEKAYTGKQLATLLEIPAPTVHYHLKALEKNGFVEVVDTEIKNGIVQKFYKAVAYGIIISDNLLPHSEEISDSIRGMALSILSRAQDRVLNAPDDAFELKPEPNPKGHIIANQLEVKLKEERFIEWVKKYVALKEELLDMEPDEDGNWYYLAHLGFKVDEPLFENKREIKKNE